tara:strand:- start:1862 stop:2458 length:597 start_codon:yes stop_codon:yes gene_type:complete
MDTEKTTIAILILAAGASSRMGSPKQLLPWKNTTLLGNAIMEAKAIVNTNLFIVLGANEAKIKTELNLKTESYFINPNWQKGLGNTVAFGISQIENSRKKYAKILVMLADQPLIDRVYLTEMITAYRASGKSIVATNYGKRVGVPAIFSNQYFSELKKLDHDFGAKEILKKYPLDTLSLDPKGKEKDIDTIEDYNKLM